MLLLLRTPPAIAAVNACDVEIATAESYSVCIIGCVVASALGEIIAASCQQCIRTFVARVHVSQRERYQSIVVVDVRDVTAACLLHYANTHSAGAGRRMHVAVVATAWRQRAVAGGAGQTSLVAAVAHAARQRRRREVLHVAVDVDVAAVAVAEDGRMDRCRGTGAHA